MLHIVLSSLEQKFVQLEKRRSMWEGCLVWGY